MTEICTIVTVLRETPEATLRFVAWHLEIGARLHVFLDDPEDSVADRLAAHPNVQVTRCTPDFWRGLGVEPDARFTLRQNAALTEGYRRAGTPWVLAMDGDEFLYLSERSIAEFVAELADVPAVCFLPAEAVRTDDGRQWFRVGVERKQIRQVYGEDARYFAPRGGLVGHSEGKSMTRSGMSGLSLRQHWAVDGEGQAVNGVTVGRAEGAFLLHFFDSGYGNWRRKFEWRTSSWGFARRTVSHFDTPDEGDLQVLYKRLHHLDPERLDALEARGGVVALDLDLDAPRLRVFGA